MKRINAEKRYVVREPVSNIPVREITSYEQLLSLGSDADVAIMHSMTMRLGKLTRCADTLMVYDGVDHIVVRPDSFKHGNFMYEILY